jgi:hypothetical protein
VPSKNVPSPLPSRIETVACSTLGKTRSSFPSRLKIGRRHGAGPESVARGVLDVSREGPVTLAQQDRHTGSIRAAGVTFVAHDQVRPTRPRPGSCK